MEATTFVPKMMPPLTDAEMEAMKTPQLQPTVDTSSPFASVPKPYDEATVTAQDTADAEAARQLAQNDYDYSEYMSDIAGTEWATTQALINSFGDEGPDLNWSLTPQHVERWKKEVPAYMQDRLATEDIFSEKQFESAIARLKLEDEQTTRLSTASGFGQTGRFLWSMVDPTEVAAAIATEIGSAGLATPMLVAKYGLKAKNAKMLTGAVSNAALGVGFNMVRDDGDMPLSDYGWSLAFDAVLGGMIGRLDPSMVGVGQRQIEDLKLPKSEVAKKIDTAWEEFEALRTRAADITAPRVLSTGELNLDPVVPPQSSVGAAQATTDAIRPGVTTAPELTNADAPKTHALDKGRISVVGQAMASDSPMERLIMPHLGEDAVGRNDGSVTPISTAEYARQKHTATEASWKQALVPAFRKWQENHGHGMIRRAWSGAKDFDEFSKHVYDFIEDTRPDAANFYEPEVIQAGTRAREILKHYAELYHNPGLEDGQILRSIAGAERLKPDPFYFPKIADREAIDDLTAKYGFVQIRSAVRQAVDAAMTQQGYDIKAELLDKVAEGWLTNISKAGYGQEDGIAQIMSGRSKSRMYEVLGAAGIDEDVVKEIVQAMDASDAKTPRLKARTPIDYRFSTPLQNQITGQMEEFRPLDFFERNVDHVMMAYTRRAAGEVAMARLRIKDPTAPGFFVDGITSSAEFEQKILKPLADDWQRRGGGEEGRIKSKQAQDRAKFLYNATVGLPLHEMNPTHATWARRVRDYNFLRLMNAMGITQAIEFGRMFSMLGMKAAFEQMPSIKRVIDPNTGSIMLKNKMAREMEMWGVTENDYWIGASKYNFQEELAGEKSSRLGSLGDKYDKLVNRGKEVMAYTSFQRPVHSRQQQWAARAAVQWFADNARDMKKFAKFKDRIADMGLNEADMKAIREQVVKWADSADPEKRKITGMNFEKWDPEVRSKFLSAVRRYTNRIIQVNEPGNLPMFFSHPVAQTFLQFRSFSIAAYDKSTLWNMKHHDQQSVMIALGDIVFGAATFALMANIRAFNRDDREEYLQEQLSLGNLAAMGFARSGISSIVPMLVDTGLMFTPLKPMFMGSRTSGSATDALGGSAPIDLFNSIASSSKAFADSVWTSRELSQQEVKGMVRSSPFSNAIPTMLMLESMIKDRELMAPRQEQ